MKFDKFDQVFCDSIEALEVAYRSGLKKNQKIITSSPALKMCSKFKNIELLEARYSQERIIKYQKSIYNFTLLIYNTLKKSNFKQYSISAAQEGIFFQRLVRRALYLSNNDYLKKNLFIKLDCNDHFWNSEINPPWSLIFKESNFKTITYKVTHHGKKNYKIHYPNKFELLNILSFENIFYFIYKKMKRIFFFKKKKFVLIFREDHLLREICTYLFLNGIEGRFFSPKKIDQNQNFDDLNFQKIRKLLYPIILEFTQKWVKKNFQKQIIESYFTELKKKLNERYSYKVYFREYLKNLNGKFFCFSSYPASPITLGLSDQLMDMKKYLVSSQHGVAREINVFQKELRCSMENSVSDLFFVQNEEAKKICDNSKFRKGKSIVVGAPKQMYQSKKVSFFLKQKRIFYISTRFSAGSMQMLQGYINDFQRTIREQNLVRYVFSQVPHKINFKAYPCIDPYVDVDPVFHQIEKTNNLKLINSSKDLQYYLNEIRIIITSRATSTLGWCLFSNKPIIFINYNDHFAVRNNIVRLFKKSLIFFDANEKNFFSKLKIYLSQSLNKIEADWEKKKYHRNILIKKYFNANEKKIAGRVGANFLLQNNYLK